MIDYNVHLSKYYSYLKCQYDFLHLIAPLNYYPDLNSLPTKYGPFTYTALHTNVKHSALLVCTSYNLLTNEFFSPLILLLSAAATGPAIGTLIASYAEYNRTIVIASFTGGMALMGAFVPSLKVNPLDLSPNYAGSLMAVVGCVGAISGILAPQLVGFMTTHVIMPP